MTNNVVISRDDLKILLEDSLELEALVKGGVRKWKNYEPSMNEFRKQMWEELKEQFEPELLESTKDITISDLAYILSSCYIIRYE